MSRNIKTSYAAYAAWNVEMEELALNRQSEQGWQLLKGGCFHTIYEQDSSIRYIHKIDYNPDIKNGSDEKNRYIELFAEQGWEYVNTTYNGWNYLRKKYDESLPISEYEIYTDASSYRTMMKRWIRLGRLLQILELIIGIQNLIIGTSVDSSMNVMMSFFLFAIVVWLQNGISKIKARY